jgi:hypothetical protein
MPHIIEFSLNLKVDGVSYPNFPLIRRLQVDQLQPLGQIQTAGTGYTSLASLLTALQVGVIQVDESIDLRLNNQSTGSIPINAGGLIAFIDVNINTATLISALIGATDANLNGLLGGSK